MVTPTLITMEEMRNDLVRIATAKRAEVGEDFAYVASPPGGSCKYVKPGPDGKPVCDCLLGHWLYSRGVPMELLIEHVSLPFRYFVNRAFAEPFIKLDQAAISFGNEVQIRQDAGRPWLSAIDVATWYINQANKYRS